jgi:REP element-mobilizing transposase RayT
MPRKARIESNDSVYHVINRGNYRSFIFETEGAKVAFERTLFEACERAGWELLAYCILSNHFHLCLGNPNGNLSEGMRWLQATFANRFNRYRKESGHLFQGRFKSLVVESGQPLLTLVNYIHLNPLRAGLETAERLGSYPWSSLCRFPKRKSRPAFADVSWMQYLGDVFDTSGGWTRYRNLLRLRATDDRKEIEKLEKAMNRGWCIGSKAFRKAFAEELKQPHAVARLENEQLKEFNEERWQACLAKALKAVKKSPADTGDAKRSDPWKLAIASKMKRETSVSNKWLGEQLHMGVARGVSSNCAVYRKKREARCPHAKRLKNFTFAY